MKISVIIPCRGAGGTLASALESALSQRGAEVECIAVDGASSDGTTETLREYETKSGGRLRWISEPDGGLYDAIDKGISLATGDVVGVLNADDVFEDAETLSAVASAFSPSVDAVYGDVRFVKNDLEATVRRYGAAHWRPWMHHFGYMPPHPGVYIRRPLFARLGGYKTDYRISADFELLVRYLCRGKVKSAYLPRCLVRMRMGGMSTSGWRANCRLNVENVRANRENGYRSCLPMMLPKYFFKVWGFLLR